MTTKICTKCHQELPISEFAYRNKDKGTRRADCKKCHSQFMKDKYHEKRLEIQDLKTEQKCIKCGYSRCSEALHFHHIDETTKSENIARMIANSYGLERARFEIEKCVVLCANCHAEFHYMNRYYNYDLEQFLADDAQQPSDKAEDFESSIPLV